VNSYLLMITFRVAFVEIAVSGFNYFVLMNWVYQPRYGELRAHQVGMSTRIAYIFVFAYFIPYFAKTHAASDMLVAGGFWLLMILAFEWIGSFILRRPVHDVLVGWHIERGYMWPYVLLAYASSPVIVGSLLQPGS
jgi:hypothetical protein